MIHARRLRVHGRVQGVFYRNWAVDNARALGLAGWVRNEPDGSVAVHLEGSHDAIDQMVARLHEGPPQARVERVQQMDGDIEGHLKFSQR